MQQLYEEFEQKKKKVYEEETNKLAISNSKIELHKSPSTLLALDSPSGTDVIKKTAELELKEAELRETKKKYKSLEDKYYRMKEELQNLVVNVSGVSTKIHRSGSNIKNTNVPNTIDEMSIATGVGAAAISTDDEEHRIEQEQSSQHDSVLSNNSGPTSNKKIDINVIMAGSNDRLSKALSALENLREQIIEIKSDPDLQIGKKNSSTTLGKSSVAAAATTNGHHVNVYPTREVHHYHNENLPAAAAGYANSKLKSSFTSIRTSVSTSDLTQIGLALGVQEKENTGDSNHYEFKNRQIVENAKDFIRAQKQRLALNSSLYSSQLNPSTFHQSFPRIRRIDDTNFTGNNLLLSEITDSSGIGTFNSQITIPKLNGQYTGIAAINATQDRAQVAKDIDGILVSLKHLDKQMKYMWSVVGQKPIISPNPSNSSVFETYQLQHEPTTTYFTPLIHPMSVPAMEHLDQLIGNTTGSKSLGVPNYYWDESSLKYKELSSSILPNFAGQSSNNNYNNASSFATLESQLNTFKSALNNQQQQQQQRQFGGDDIILQQSQIKLDFQVPASLVEKTKDLREWLQNF